MKLVIQRVTLGRVRVEGGVVGEIVSIDDEYLVIVSENTRLRVVRAAIAARVENP